MPDDRITARVVTTTRNRWLFALILTLLGGYPDAEDVDIKVVVTDTVRGLQWDIPFYTIDKAKRIRDQIVATAATMSEAEIDEWSVAGRWATLKE